MHNLIPTTYNDHLLIVGYSSSSTRYKATYTIPLASITASVDHEQNSDKSMEWTKLSAADHYWTSPVPSSSPPVTVGGENATGKVTADIKMYDNSMKSWKKIESLSSARSTVAVAAVYNNAIVVIGGYTEGKNVGSAKSSSLKLVELGQAELQ